MPGDPQDGMLSQDDIDAALAAAGYATESAAPQAAEPVAVSSAIDDGGLSQADIDAALAAAGQEMSAGAATAVIDERLDSAGRPFDEVAAAMAAAIESEAAAARAMPPPPAGSSPFTLPDLAGGASAAGSALNQAIDLLRDVQLNVKIELGRTRMLVDDVLKLGEGSVVELDKLAGDPVDVFVNERLVARGEVLVLNDNFCVRINDIVQQQMDEE